MKRIVCFGDSNTWGGTMQTMERFPEIQDGLVFRKALGSEYQIIEEGGL